MSKTEIIEWGKYETASSHLMNGASFDAALDFSVIPGVFEWGPAAGETATLLQLTVNIQDLNVQAAKYGGIAKLNPGFVFTVRDGADNILAYLGTGNLITTNFDLISDFSEQSTSIVNFPIGDDVIAASIELWSNGGFLTLSGEAGHKISTTLTEDMSGLTAHEFDVLYKIHKDF